MPHELPITPAPEQVKAILESRMTQFRKVIVCEEMRPLGPHGCMWPYRRGKEIPDMPGVPVWEPVKPRYQVGDELWVQEKIRFNSSGGAYPVMQEWISIEYAADRKMRTIYFDKKAPILKGGGKNGYKWHSSHVMYKWAARLWLRVTAIKDPQQIQNISREDCIAEGWPRNDPFPNMNSGDKAKAWFKELWNRLHPKPGEQWPDNPWVFGYVFERITR